MKRAIADQAAICAERLSDAIKRAHVAVAELPGVIEKALSEQIEAKVKLVEQDVEAIFGLFSQAAIRGESELELDDSSSNEADLALSPPTCYDYLTWYRTQRSHFFFRDTICPQRVFVVMVTHLVINQLPLLDALNRQGSRLLLIPKANSINHQTLTAFRAAGIRLFKLGKDTGVYESRLRSRQVKATLMDPGEVGAARAADLARTVNSCNPQELPVVALDVGGYFHRQLDVLVDKIKNFRGVIEDTENGHQKYASRFAQTVHLEGSLDKVPCPIWSVARSRCKDPEDAFVGEAVVHATETLLRQEFKSMLRDLRFARWGHTVVVGYGKIGRSVTRALAQYGMRFTICEKSASLRLRAASEYPSAPVSSSLQQALYDASLVFSCTGSKAISTADLECAADGVILSSVTSRTDEFGDLTDLLKINNASQVLFQHTTSYRLPSGKMAHFLADGDAVNFLFGGIVGDRIHQLHVLILIAISALKDQISDNTSDLCFQSVPATFEEEAVAYFEACSNEMRTGFIDCGRKLSGSEDSDQFKTEVRERLLNLSPGQCLEFEPGLDGFQRKMVHEVANEMGWPNESVGEGKSRYIKVSRPSLDDVDRLRTEVVPENAQADERKHETQMYVSPLPREPASKSPNPEQICDLRVYLLGCKGLIIEDEPDGVPVMVTCEVEGRSGEELGTSPAFQYTVESETTKPHSENVGNIVAVKSSDALQFAFFMHDEEEGDMCFATATLSPQCFFQTGFDGSIPMQGDDDVEVAEFMVKVEVINAVAESKRSQELELESF